MARPAEDFKKLEQQTLVRCGMYSFLAGVFSSWPARGFLQNLSRSGFLPNVSDVIGIPVDFGAFNAEFQTKSLDEIYRNIHSDFTALFTPEGARAIPPYETSYRGGTEKVTPPTAVGGVTVTQGDPADSSRRGDSHLSEPWPEEAQEVARFYSEAGYDIQGSYDGRPDHVGMELEFMALLCEREMGAWQQKDSLQAREYLEFEKGFLTGHLDRWIPRFCETAERNSQSNFYRSAARLLGSFLGAERERLCK